MDPARVEELYRLYGFAVHRRCLRLLRTQGAADDALQDVFVRVLRYGTSFDERQPLGWLYRIAENVCFDRIALERRRRETADKSQHDASVLDTTTGRPDERQLLLELLAQAQPNERPAAVLHYLDGLTHAEIAAELGCSRETVTQRLGKFHDQAKKSLLRGAVL